MKKPILYLVALFMAINLHAQNASSTSVGDKIAVFSGYDDSGSLWNSKNLKSDYLIVYFYPAAMTGGCTKQACSYRDDKSVFDALNATVIGVSGDETKNLAYFKTAHNLNFTLLSDKSGDISKLFGVPIKDGGSITREISGKEVLLERGITTPRWTFILDNSGKIIYKNANVNAVDDSAEVRKAILKHTNAK